MPSTKGLEVFVRKDQIIGEEWLDLIEARRELIKPHLDSFTLPELGSLECLKNENFMHELKHDFPISTGDPRFSLKTQGVFSMQPWGAVERTPNSGYRPWPSDGHVNCPDGIKRIWGLTRSSLWVLITVEFIGEEGYKDRGYELASTVNIVEADLPTIIATTKEKPQRMWEQLGNVIRSFAVHRKWLYDQASYLVWTIEAEELALSLVSKAG